MKLSDPIIELLLLTFGWSLLQHFFLLACVLQTITRVFLDSFNNSIDWSTSRCVTTFWWPFWPITMLAINIRTRAFLISILCFHVFFACGFQSLTWKPFHVFLNWIDGSLAFPLTALCWPLWPFWCNTIHCFTFACWEERRDKIHIVEIFFHYCNTVKSFTIKAGKDQRDIVNTDI